MLNTIFDAVVTKLENLPQEDNGQICSEMRTQKDKYFISKLHFTSRFINFTWYTKLIQSFIGKNHCIVTVQWGLLDLHWSLFWYTLLIDGLCSKYTSDSQTRTSLKMHFSWSNTSYLKCTSDRLTEVLLKNALTIDIPHIMLKMHFCSNNSYLLRYTFWIDKHATRLVPTLHFTRVLAWVTSVYPTLTRVVLGTTTGTQAITPTLSGLLG